MFVTAQPPGPAPAANPKAPPQQAPAQADSRIGRLLDLVWRLILYGNNLENRLSQCAGTPAFTRLAGRFGTTDLARIIRRIARGVMLAFELYERLERRAARGRDIKLSPVRVPSPRKSATPRKRARRAKPQPAADVFDLPTPEEIAAMARRRPIGAVIVDICRDLGIMQGNVPPELWRELHDAIIDYGGSLARYLAGAMDQALGPLPDKHVSPAPRGSMEPRSGSIEPGVETPRSSPPVPPALATGPP